MRLLRLLLLGDHARGPAIAGKVGAFDHIITVIGEALIAQDASLACRRRELGQLEVAMGRLEAALQVVEADRREEVERVDGVS